MCVFTHRLWRNDPFCQRFRECVRTTAGAPIAAETTVRHETSPSFSIRAHHRGLIVLAFAIVWWAPGTSLAAADISSSSRCGDRTTPSVAGVITGSSISLKRLPSLDTAWWLLAGGAAAAATYPADADVSRRMSESNTLHDVLHSGDAIGSGAAQFAASIGTYATGLISKNPCLGELGADLISAQLVAEALTFAIQYSVRRTRPDDGSGFGFPSGHVSVTFASATILQQQFGWKAGVPAYAVASYVAASRIQVRRHYLSDVVFGAVLGIVSARVTTASQKHRFLIVPAVAADGAGIEFVLNR
jgi:membrane-associated phospholipid phosphatase